MRFFLNVFLLILISQASFAQSGDLMVEGASPNLYVEHTVVAKENWYSIGRLYNISPKEIAPFNSTSMDKPLSIGEKVRIPLNASNFSQNGQKAADEVFVPVYHIVAEKEWMYRISTNYNKVPTAYIEKWNGITNDQLKAGMKLVVGYLKVKPSQSILAAKGSATIKTETATVVETKSTTTPGSTGEAAAATTATQQTTVKTEDKKTETVAEKTAPATVSENKPVTAATTTTPANVDFKGGYFKSQFDNGSKSSSGSAAIFRSTSGWSDGKYYALMNNVPVGTIVKVSNTSNNKIVYAKVLGNLADIKENSGLAIRISNAAAAELGAGENKFSASIAY
ncbi:LysM peptidoglycan-binding domain-containing protein [Pinibacter soli]|uniref:LysM peptidoglycan-binding domain-containing protein n=1 Tax=Pinibacter soli TaxID=3044211 RepID=A0ABT6RGY6_9BACT|nr:LysM peptidoglycan-binding domain-containing protein [Pinibacter soli]MDI3321832.1 LysM peptidoglycan-binding domain-containing protein [Pinibacter soli]